MFLDEVIEMIYHPKETNKQLTIFDVINGSANNDTRNKQ